MAVKEHIVLLFVQIQNITGVAMNLFYLITKFQLQEWLVCKIIESRLICGLCDNCGTCFHINCIRQCLADACLFYPRTDGFQPLQWRLYFNWLYNSNHFRIEILE